MLKKPQKFFKKKEFIYLSLIFFLALFFYGFFIYKTTFRIGNETYFTLIDDAMISMRYAKNFSNGFGFVWNLGDPPIQGFTNPGWTFYMVLLHKIPIPESKISLLVIVTAAFLLLGITYLSFKLCKIITPQLGKSPFIAAAITAFYYPLVFWSLRGMEVSIATFLVYVLVLLVLNSSTPINIRKALIIGSIMFLAIAVRIDIVLQITLILGYVAYDHLKHKANFKPVLIIFLFYVAGIIGISLFQYYYFGSVLPNTYYLKVIGTTLLERIFIGSQVFVEYATRDFLTPLSIIIIGLILFRSLREKRVVLLLALFIIQCAYSVYVGGDYAEPLDAPQVEAANRFITQGMPSIIVLFSVVVGRFLQMLDKKDNTQYVNNLSVSSILAIVIILASVIIMSGANWFKWTIHNAPLLDADIWRAKLGVHISEYTDENAIVAVHAAGQISYYSNRQTVDLLGKSDPVVAMGSPVARFRPGHNKWNYEYSIMTLQPDLIADEWGQLDEFLADKPDYFRLINGIWIQKNSIHINIEGLEQSYR